jgi:hypothetical protein
VLNKAVTEFACVISSVCLVSASWMPKTRPAARPVSVARACPLLRRPTSTATNATPAMIAAAYHCENEPNDRPIGVIDRDNDSRPTPPHKMRAPTTSATLTGCRDIGTARTSAHTR